MKLYDNLNLRYVSHIELLKIWSLNIPSHDFKRWVFCTNVDDAFQNNNLTCKHLSKIFSVFADTIYNFCTILIYRYFMMIPYRISSICCINYSRWLTFSTEGKCLEKANITQKMVIKLIAKEQYGVSDRWLQHSYSFTLTMMSSIHCL